jgi:hypothetical protein
MQNKFKTDYEKELESLNENWDWNRVFRAWKQTINEFNLNVDSLFLTVQVHDAKDPKRKSTIPVWWEKQD